MSLWVSTGSRNPRRWVSFCDWSKMGRKLTWDACVEKWCVRMGKIWMLDLGLWRHKSHQYLCLKHLRSVYTKSAKNACMSDKGDGTPSLPPSQLHPHKPLFRNVMKNHDFCLGEFWVHLGFVAFSWWDDSTVGCCFVLFFPINHYWKIPSHFTSDILW